MTKGLSLKFLSSIRTVTKVAVLALALSLSACGAPEDRAQSYANNGARLLEKGDLTRASLEFRNALQLKNDFLSALNGLLKIEEQRKNWSSMTAILARIVELSPDDVTARVRYGRMLLILGAIEGAVTQSEAAFNLDPEDPSVLALYGAVRLKVEDMAGAVEFAQKALSIDPANVDAAIVLVAERLIADDPNGAIKFLDGAVTLDDANVSLLLIRIQLLETINDLKGAEAVYQRLIELQPGSMELRRSYALFLMRQNRNPEAEAVFRNMASRANGEIEPLLDVIRYLNTVEGHKSARQQLVAYVEEHPKDLRLRFALAELSLNADDAAAGKKILRDIADFAGGRAEGVAAINRLTQIALSEGDKDGALALITETLGRDKNNADALILQASIDIDRRNLEKAITSLRAVLHDVPDSVPALLLEARAHELNGANELAETSLARAFRFSQAGQDAGLAYTQFLLRHGKVERSEDVLLAVLSRDPANAPALKTLANVRLLRQDWLGAQEIGEILKQIDTNDDFADRVLGESLAGQEKFDQSIGVLQQAYQKGPIASRPLVGLIRTYIRAGRSEDAIAFLNNILESNPDHYQARLLVGETYAIRGELEAAEAAFRKAIALEADNPSAYQTLFALLMREQRFDDADVLINSALAVMSNDVNIRILKASVLEVLEKFEAAIDIYEELYVDFPNAPVIANNLASLLSEHRDDQASLMRALKVAERFGETEIPHFKDTLGWANFRIGNTDLASSLLREAVEQKPDEAIFHYHLGMSYLQNGQKDAAKSELEEALRLSVDQSFPLADRAKEALRNLN